MSLAVSFASLKSHVIAFVEKEAVSLDASYHALVHKFVAWAEAEEVAVRAAVHKLMEHGYTVTAPAGETIPVLTTPAAPQ